MSKKDSGSTIGAIVIIIIIAIIFGVIKGCNAVVQYFSEGSVQEQAQIVLDFEKEVYSIELQTEDIGKQVATELNKIADHNIPDLDLIDKAEDKFMSASNQLKSLDIPSGLTEEREIELEDIKTDFEQAYAFKSYAMMNFSKYLINHDEKDLQEFVEMTSLAQDNLTGAIAGIAMLKKELGVVDVDVSKQ
ncbi:hypothetical protein P9578_27600 [Brevibacillus choshinensis]|uniref:hypothetical protein n=1 Tax=Brevibacillus choshinensis TaxID=54911 RepID=UPI002E1B6547|nr:hypothetical protein [Brevibacillus choshinensis]